MVLKHIFDNFDFYNRGDLDTEVVTPLVAEISGVFDFPFDETLSPAEARAIVKVRLRQTEFKANLFGLWQGCSLKGLDVNARYLVASHILPWSKSSDTQKISKYNGFLLPPNYDYLFDRHLASFSDDGSILLQETEETQNFYGILGIDSEARLKMVFPRNIPYLKKHREVFFEILKLMPNQRFQSDGSPAAPAPESYRYGENNGVRLD